MDGGVVDGVSAVDARRSGNSRRPTLNETLRDRGWSRIHLIDPPDCVEVLWLPKQHCLGQFLHSMARGGFSSSRSRGFRGGGTFRSRGGGYRGRARARGGSNTPATVPVRDEEGNKLAERFEQVRLSDEVDEKIGFPKIQEGPQREGWMINMHPVRVVP